MNPAALLALSKNRAARWGAGVGLALLCLWLARCSGERAAHADDAITSADAAAKISQHVTDSLNKIRDSIAKVLRDSVAAAAAAAAKAEASARRADSVARRLAIIGSIRVVHRDSLSAPTQGPDTTAYATIQRQGDPALYTVPQFSVDAFNDQRRALADAQADAATKTRLLARTQSLLHADSVTFQAQGETVLDAQRAEDVAKSASGRECHLMPFVPCPPRKLVAIGAFALGAAAGAIAVHDLAR